jgi:SAM-dependent methyltransferase
MSGLEKWFQTPPGRYAQAWVQTRLDDVVVDIFGYHALQLGLSEQIDALAANRMPHRWRAGLAACDAQAPTKDADEGAVAPASRIALVTNPQALPFAQASLDLVVVPHAFSDGQSPQLILKEIDRVLVHEGRVVISGVNQLSLWGLARALPKNITLVNSKHLIAYLHNTELEIEKVYYGGYGWPRRDVTFPQSLRWRDKLQARIWPSFGALWCIVAVKRSHGAVLVGPAWKTIPAGAGAQAGVAQKTKSTTENISTSNINKN